MGAVQHGWLAADDLLPAAASGHLPEAPRELLYLDGRRLHAYEHRYGTLFGGLKEAIAEWRRALQAHLASLEARNGGRGRWAAWLSQLKGALQPVSSNSERRDGVWAHAPAERSGTLDRPC